VSFKVGDKVLCIDSRDSHKLKVGDTYTVSAIDIAGDYVCLRGNLRHLDYAVRRFIKADQLTAYDKAIYGVTP
jgi:hypothetical protein